MVTDKYEKWQEGYMYRNVEKSTVPGKDGECKE
jgi:hypothetical protein